MSAKGGLLDRYAHLYTAVVCDALDDLGQWQRTLDQHIQPLLPDRSRLVGFARTLRATPSERLGSWLPHTYERWTTGYDGLGAEDVLVISIDTPPVGAVFGQLRTERMKRIGCRGLVTNGLIRDTPVITHIDFPIFAAGRTPEDCRGRLEYSDHGIPVKIGDVMISPGDFIIADLDGVVIIPRSIAEEVATRAEALAEQHEWIQQQLRTGRPAREVMETYARGRERE